jgi:GH43 family beta-xylosidase
MKAISLLFLSLLLPTLLGARSFTNPLLEGGADPWVVYHAGFYYYTNTLGDRLQIWKTRHMEALRSATTRVVWRAPPSGPNSTSVWAPELHRLNAKWYLYFTAADREHDDDAHRHVFVLENKSADPLSGTWVERGMLNTAHTGIDGTVFSDRGRLYFVYSAYVGPDSDLIIAPMENPWTLGSPQIDIARPTLDWEKQGGRQILEGPEFLEGHRGQRILLYSASACWSDDYSLGMLVAAPGADLLDAGAWKKMPEPVFKKSPANGVYAPGHNGLFKSPDGREDWIIYHANSAPGQRCKQRSPRMQKFSWRDDGLPDFGEPVGGGVELEAPAGR